MFLGLLLPSLIVSIHGAALSGSAKPSICSGGATLIPHPKECQRYTNCSMDPSLRWTRYLGEYEDECRYPDLFDVTERRCKPFKEANCGSGRHAPKDPCDYLKNRCGGAHCEPCSSRWPSCVGKVDGIQPHPMKLWSPYYALCESERTVAIKTCPSHAPTNSGTIFSPVRNSCVPRWEIPASRGGVEPSCDGKEAGKLYPYPGRSDIYFSCHAPSVFYCGSENNTAEVKQLCEQSGNNV